jgi:hypothetical protein
MILSLTGIGIASVVVFSTWHFTSFIVKFKQDILTYASGSIEITYILLMSYLLITLSSTYLVILLSLTLIKTILGVLAMILPTPNDYTRKKNEIIESFWTKTTVDAIIGLICYCTMLWGGINYGQ